MIIMMLYYVMHVFIFVCFGALSRYNCENECALNNPIELIGGQET